VIPTFLVCGFAVMVNIDIKKITELIDPVIDDEGFEIIDVEFNNEQLGWVLRVYIDKSGGVNVDDCAAISREVSNLLEVEDVIDVPYRLEISSPGLNRPLRKKEHFQKVTGKMIKVKTKLPIENAKNFKAKLVEVGDSWIKIDNGIKETQIELDNILKANLIYKF
jgi:ribosome maturation factor RimP